MDFSHALLEIKKGKIVQRKGWNGKGMWIVLIMNWTIDKALQSMVIGLQPAPFIAMKTADANFVPWLASQTDILAEDWILVG
jgi:hypothetical protein